MEVDRAVEEALGILSEIEARGGVARTLGGIAVGIRCVSAQADGPLARTYGDLDLATNRGSAAVVAEVVEAGGYQPSKRFNAAHGRTRLLFTNELGKHLDVFIGRFAMCHALELDSRLQLHDQTLSLADLLLTKLQIAALNHKDLVDIAALLGDHALTGDEIGVNLPYVSDLLARDWGWWRTVTENTAKVAERAPDLGLPVEQLELIRGRAAQLLEAVEEHPKSMKWRMRAKVGDRVPWRDDPEEVTTA